MSTDYIELAASGIRSLQPYQPGKPIEELERELGLTDVIKLASNENPMGPSERVKNAIQTVLPDLARYPDGSAFLLKNRLSEFLGVAPEQLTIGNGSNDVLELIGRVFLSPQNESIISEHAFVVYPLVTKAVGANLKVIPAKNYSQDLNATADAVSDKTRCIFIANPNNPTGTWIGKKALTDFLARIPDDILVVLDEAYFEYVEEADYPNGLDLVDQHSNLIVTRTFSKAYGLAALRIGYAVSHPDIADLMNRVRQPFNVNSMSQAAALAALDDQSHVKKAVALNKEGMVFLQQACERLGLGYIPSVGNFLSIDFGRDAGPIYEALLRKGVIVRPIGVYGLPNHLRVTLGLSTENQKFVDCLEQVLKNV